MEWMGRPSAAKELRVGEEKTVEWGWIVERSLKPLLAVKMSRSRVWSPMAMAGRGVVPLAWVMMPKGMLAREKCEVAGMGNQDLSGMMFDVGFVSFSLKYEVYRGECFGGDNKAAVYLMRSDFLYLKSCLVRMVLPLLLLLIK